MLIGFLKWMFYVTMPCAIIICLISNATEIENIPFVNEKLRNQRGHIDRKALIIFRLLTTYLMMFLTFLIDDEFYLMIFVGLVATPFIGFMVPVLVDVKLNSDQPMKSKLFKFSLMTVCLAISVYCAVQKFTEKGN